MMKKAESNYEFADKKIVELKKRIPRIINNIRLRLAIFDEINLTLIERIVGNEYQSVRDEAVDVYLEIAKKTYKEAYDYAMTLGYIDGTYNPLWLGAITDWLLEYDEVTGYVFENEINRKRDRFVENIVSLLLKGVNHESVEMLTAYKKSAKYLGDQIAQYGDTVAYKAMMKAYEDAGVTTVVWLSEYDNRVCPTCLSMNGLKFLIDRVPAKPHWGCRCWLVPERK